MRSTLGVEGDGGAAIRGPVCQHFDLDQDMCLSRDYYAARRKEFVELDRSAAVVTKEAAIHAHIGHVLLLDNRADARIHSPDSGTQADVPAADDPLRTFEALLASANDRRLNV